VTLLSVVIPIHDVEPYLEACLRSVARQTVGDLEAIMVDDGSNDGSPAIAERFAARDRRFRLIRQANAGLGAARNTGIEVASGEFLAFVDGDDLLPRNGYELLLDPLVRTGSDFATGNVQRLTSGGATRSTFLQKVFGETRLRTHVTRFPPLLTDRIAPNKLWRRSFWDAHRFRFPEGMLHEDIPVVVPAQFAARSVDVIADPVYLWRVRQGADSSITQRRAERRALVDRLKAIDLVRDYLNREGRRRARRWYDRSVIVDDLTYYLDVLDVADDEYRATFLDRANVQLDRAGRRACSNLPAIDRLKWHLVRRRLLSELLEVLTFQRERLRRTPPLHIGRRWYGDYPFRTDRKLRIPNSVYRLDRELTLKPRVESMRFDRGALEIEGDAHIDWIGAPRSGSQRVTISALRPGRLRRLRLRASAQRFKTSEVHRPGLQPDGGSWGDLRWSGFEAALDLHGLRRLGRSRASRWELYATVSAGGVTRRRVRFGLDGARPVYGVDCTMPEGVLIRAVPTRNSRLEIRVEENWARLRTHRLTGGIAELRGEIRTSGGGAALQVTGLAGPAPLAYPLESTAEHREAGLATFVVGVPLDDLRTYFDSAHQSAHAAEGDEEIACDLWIVDGARRFRLLAGDDFPEALWPFSDHELALYRTREGHAALVGRAQHLVVTDAGWTAQGALEISGDVVVSDRAPDELLLLARETGERCGFPVHEAGDGRFESRLRWPAEVSQAASPAARSACWDIYAGRSGKGDGLMPSVLVGQALYARLPLAEATGPETHMFTMTPNRQAVLTVERDPSDGEPG
jgi:CDP-glycerol glycerophosphotransferase